MRGKVRDTFTEISISIQFEVHQFGRKREVYTAYVEHVAFMDVAFKDVAFWVQKYPFSRLYSLLQEVFNIYTFIHFLPEFTRNSGLTAI
jgi:hypothetical protein